KQNVSGCNYHITAIGSAQLCSFTSSCSMNKEENTSFENKLATPMNENSEVKISPEENLPGGSDLVDKRADLKNSFLSDTLSGSQKPVITYPQKSSAAAYISGVIDGNSITGTLTCWMTDGKSV